MKEQAPGTDSEFEEMTDSLWIEAKAKKEEESSLNEEAQQADKSLIR